MSERILIVDDDFAIRELIDASLEQEGMNVSHAASGKEALQLLDQFYYSLIVLDIMMDEMDGFEVLQRIRSDQIGIPVILLSARSSDFDKIQGLNLGADDYVTKPFSPSVLVARIHAHIRRFRYPGSNPNAETYRYGPNRLDLESQILTMGKQTIQLTATEAMIMRVFMKYPNQSIEKTTLFHEVWGPQAFDDNVLNVSINRLRKKIENDPQNPQLIRTVWGLGYRFCGQEAP